MSMYKEPQFWMRVALAALAFGLFISVHAIYWPVIISLILTFILIPIRDIVLKGFLRLTHHQLPSGLAIIISFFLFIVIMTIITNIIIILIITTNK